MSAHTNRHTPGPLDLLGKVERVEVGGFYAIGERGLPTAYVATEADARLYRTAPELLEVLMDLRESVIDAYRAGRIAAEPSVRAGNVIAKAVGQ